MGLSAGKIAGIQGGLGALAAIGGAIYGSVKSGKLNNKARELVQKQRDDNQAWYDIKMSKDYTNRSDVQAAINRQRELLDEQYKRARATSVVAGGTDEAAAMQKAAANRAVAEATADIASNAANYKDSVESQYRSQDAALNQQQVQSYQQQAGQVAQAASQVVNSGLNMLGNSFDTFGKSPAKVNENANGNTSPWVRDI